MKSIEHLILALEEAEKRNLITEVVVIRSPYNVHIQILFNIDTKFIVKQELAAHIRKTYRISKLQFSTFSERLFIDSNDTYE